ncbi:hypothetical protein A3E89_00990 [Candidatus Campbellbacteria bacterium RIFCSPHIGHO2_12_FULL_35_10]|uniref:Uncharacterized protein n=1 Tax=Candidatus Campbellbacteria bacterium RIFCSPHIGHO2_12_FULL_35_10 TaxID=1797578 RepID=A0A1F5EKQ1_9BACT|nr:MAG: hypothetical protein A3E89_00990 [Candidatus Campbellbacteria bacterium RIFCSPHIGHO2_12_FULL_35_10]
MPTLFYFILVFFTYLEWSWMWFILSLVFTILNQPKKSVETYPEVYYQYTNDYDLDGELVQPEDIEESNFV